MRGMRRGRLLVFRLILGTVLTATTLLFVEGAFGLMLSHPRLLARAPSRLLENFRRVYGGYYRQIVQAEPDFVVYDPELTCTLRPSTVFTHQTSEFRTTYRTNRMGLRDTDDALRAPEVIVVGDSYAMGWCVEQDEAFPQVLGSLIGLRTLNAGISSYATAREIALLDRLDTSRLKCLVIHDAHNDQYAHNDLEENASFFLSADRQIPSSPERFQEEQARFGRARSYFLGKYLAAFFWPSALEHPHSPRSLGEVQVKKSVGWLFLNALLHAGKADLSHFRILTFEMRPFARTKNDFMDSVKSERDDARYPEFVRQIVLLSMQDRLKPEHAFVLDDHLRASGHRVIAEALAAEILRSQ